MTGAILIPCPINRNKLFYKDKITHCINSMCISKDTTVYFKNPTQVNVSDLMCGEGKQSRKISVSCEACRDNPRKRSEFEITGGIVSWKRIPSPGTTMPPHGGPIFFHAAWVCGFTSSCNVPNRDSYSCTTRASTAANRFAA
jgi:hypothetical protein